MYEWLQGLDNGRGAMLQYFEVTKTEFESDFSQIAASRLPEPISPGSVGRKDPSFWEAAGVRSVGHKLLFAKGVLQLPAP